MAAAASFKKVICAPEWSEVATLGTGSPWAKPPPVFRTVSYWAGEDSTGVAAGAGVRVQPPPMRWAVAQG